MDGDFSGGRTQLDCGRPAGAVAGSTKCSSSSPPPPPQMLLLRPAIASHNHHPASAVRAMLLDFPTDSPTLPEEEKSSSLKREREGVGGWEKCHGLVEPWMGAGGGLSWWEEVGEDTARPQLDQKRDI